MKSKEAITLFCCFLIAQALCAGGRKEPAASAAEPAFAWDFVPSGKARFINIPVIEDAYIHDGDNAGINFGTRMILDFKASTSKNIRRFVFLKFDISKLTDPQITNAKLRIFLLEKQRSDNPVTVNAFSTGTDWSEAAITAQNAPGSIGRAGQARAGKAKAWLDLDITGFVRAAVGAGEQQIALRLEGVTLEDCRLMFESREGDNRPHLRVKYGGSFDPGTSRLSGGPVVIDTAAVQAHINKVFANSTAVKPESGGSSGGPLRVSSTEIHYYPAADTYARNGSFKNKNQGAETSIAYKGTPGDPETERKAFLRFDLSDFTASSVGGAFLELTNTYLQNSIETYTSALEVSDDLWTEYGLTWENMPAVGNLIGRSQMAVLNARILIDLTAFVNQKLRQGKKIFSISIQDMENKEARTEFSSREGMNPPCLRMLSPGAAAGSVPAPVIGPAASGSGAYDYVTVPLNKNRAPRTEYAPVKTRALSSLPDFVPSAEKPALSAFGGDIAPRNAAQGDTAIKKTGFFYVKKIDNRWWLIDPEGCRTLNMGIVSFTYGTTPNEKKGQQTVYGDNDAWAKKAVAHIRDDLGFNSLGAWSHDETVMRNQPFPYTKLIHFLTVYADELGKTFQESGHKGFVNDVLPVFDPAFEEFADKRAADTMTGLKNDPYLIGYFSDNELPNTINFLDNYLAIAADDFQGQYSRAAAWEWLRRRHGRDASPAALTGRDRDDFREFVYDYYARIVSAAIKRHDPNHLYLGSRLHSDAKTSPGIWRAMGRYCDAIALNYYIVWEPSFTFLADWEKWSGKPVLISEFYVKGMDSGLANTSGAGWVVPTQNDRGLFYEQFVLALLESGSCVGWHWFKYLDNDPKAPGQDPSNIDGNKGIINTAFQEYTALTSRMRTINRNVYRLVDYFTRKQER